VEEGEMIIEMVWGETCTEEEEEVEGEQMTEGIQDMVPHGEGTEIMGIGILEGAMIEEEIGITEGEMEEEEEITGNREEIIKEAMVPRGVCGAMFEGTTTLLPGTRICPEISPEKRQLIILRGLGLNYYPDRSLHLSQMLPRPRHGPPSSAMPNPETRRCMRRTLRFVALQNRAPQAL